MKSSKPKPAPHIGCCSSSTDALVRVFGSACYASAATLADLSPRMDELFLTALRELSAPKPQ